jgi:hypothetical protein
MDSMRSRWVRHPIRGTWYWALACALLLGNASCGACLLIQRQDATLRTVDGTQVPVRVEWLVPNGILMADAPVRRFVLGLLLEPVDWCISSGAACVALFSDDTDVALGPLGWLATLTPFATLFPAPEARPSRSVAVDAGQLARLRAGDLSTAQEVFGDDRVCAVCFR